MTAREDMIFYSLKKWELKDTGKYNIFQLKESNGMDLISLIIMMGNLNVIRHVIENYGTWINGLMSTDRAHT
jgi:hypothetical protein